MSLVLVTNLLLLQEFYLFLYTFGNRETKIALSKEAISSANLLPKIKVNKIRSDITGDKTEVLTFFFFLFFQMYQTLPSEALGSERR